MRRLLLLAVALVGMATAQSSSPLRPAQSEQNITATVWLSSVGLGLVALPREVASAVLLSGNPAQRIGKVLGSVDGGAESQGWWMRTSMAAPGTVNLGNLSFQWQRTATINLLGVRLGVLNTTLPVICDGQPRVVLQMDSQVGDYAAKISRVGGSSSSSAARVEYTCTDGASSVVSGGSGN